MDLSVIIVNWNTRKLLAQCLRAIEGDVETLERWNVETLVVDNASSDGSAAIVRERFPWVRLIENRENVGFARANNQAIRESEASYVLLLNSDAELRPGALPILLSFMDRHPEAGGCGAKLVDTDGAFQLSCYPVLTPWRELWRLLFLDRVLPRASYRVETWDQSEAHPVEVIEGACLLLRRRALREVGLLDERYFMYTEEMDLCYRLLQAGWRLYFVPTAEVVHHGGASSEQMAEAMYVQLYRSKVQFHRKFGGHGRALLFKMLLALAYVPRWGIATLAGSSASGTRAGVYRRLLAELPKM